MRNAKYFLVLLALGLLNPAFSAKPLLCTGTNSPCTCPSQPLSNMTNYGWTWQITTPPSSAIGNLALGGAKYSNGSLSPQLVVCFYGVANSGNLGSYPMVSSGAYVPDLKPGNFWYEWNGDANINKNTAGTPCTKESPACACYNPVNTGEGTPVSVDKCSWKLEQ